MSLPWIESTFTNQRIVSAVSAMLASESAPTRIPRASFPLSALAYGACDESSFMTTVTRFVVSTATLSPVRVSFPFGRASRLSMFTESFARESVNAPARSANVVVESMPRGSRYSASVRLCAAVSRRVIDRNRRSESTPMMGEVVVSVPSATRTPSGASWKIARLSMPGRAAASMTPAWNAGT